MALPITTGVSQRAIIDGITADFDSRREKFNALAEEYVEQVAGLSVLSVNHLAYHQIIGMGDPALPLLLERLRKGETYWVYALKCISGEQPETPGAQGNPQRVIDAWMEWASVPGE